jgi:serine/threonine protein kinase
MSAPRFSANLANVDARPESKRAVAMFPTEPFRHVRALEAFDILQRLGSGGAGEVFLARSRAGKLVAIKTIAQATSEVDEHTADVFAREASVCARLRHPCIVQVRAFLEEPGFAALVFEYVPGVALGRVLRLCQAHGVRLPDRAGWHIVERVLTALAYAHGFHDDQGTPTPIVHRDVSPANILLDWTGGVKIADFGIAKVLGVSPATRMGLVKGTMGCMAPEQARGEPVDQRADVYAAALLAWRLATGRSPFGKHHNDEHELLRAMRHPRIKPIGSIRPDLPEALLDAVTRALEPEPTDRTIVAGTLAQIVKDHIDVGAGWLELASLLEQWKGPLERTVKRAAGGEATSTEPSDKAEHTLRYEEVALAFDDDPSPDGPTFEAHALPSDAALLASLPLIERLHVASSSSAPPPATERTGAPMPDRLEHKAARSGAVASPARSRLWIPLLVFAAFGSVAAAAALLATYAR